MRSQSARGAADFDEGHRFEMKVIVLKTYKLQTSQVIVEKLPQFNFVLNDPDCFCFEYSCLGQSPVTENYFPR